MALGVSSSSFRLCQISMVCRLGILISAGQAETVRTRKSVEGPVWCCFSGTGGLSDLSSIYLTHRYEEVAVKTERGGGI